MISQLKKLGVIVAAFLSVMIVGATATNFPLSLVEISVVLVFIIFIVWGTFSSTSGLTRLFFKTSALLLAGFAFIGILLLLSGGYFFLWMVEIGLPVLLILGIVALPFLYRSTRKKKTTDPNSY